MPRIFRWLDRGNLQHRSRYQMVTLGPHQHSSLRPLMELSITWLARRTRTESTMPLIVPISVQVRYGKLDSPVHQITSHRALGTALISIWPLMIRPSTARIVKEA